MQQKAAAATAARNTLVAELTHRAEVAEEQLAAAQEQLAAAQQQLEALHQLQQQRPLPGAGSAAAADAPQAGAAEQQEQDASPACAQQSAAGVAAAAAQQAEESTCAEQAAAGEQVGLCSCLRGHPLHWQTSVAPLSSGTPLLVL